MIAKLQSEFAARQLAEPFTREEPKAVWVHRRCWPSV